MDTLSIERRDGVAVVRYRHPPRNFVTARFLHELRRAMVELEDDDSVRVVVFTGDIEDHYMLHTEMAEIRQMMALPARIPTWLAGVMVPMFRAWVWCLKRSRLLARMALWAPSEAWMVRNAIINVLLLFDAIQRSSKVTIAAINGHCIGGGMELSLCCDFRLMKQGDFVIGCPEVLIGMMPGFGGTQRMTRLLGPDKTNQILLAGRPLSPEEATECGLVSRTIPPERFWEEVMGFADELAARAPMAVAQIKRAVLRGGQMPLQAGLYEEMKGVMRLAGTTDTRRALERYDAFVEAQQKLPEDEQKDFGEVVDWLSDGDLIEFEGQ